MSRNLSCNEKGHVHSSPISGQCSYQAPLKPRRRTPHNVKDSSQEKAVRKVSLTYSDGQRMKDQNKKLSYQAENYLQEDADEDDEFGLGIWNSEEENKSDTNSDSNSSADLLEDQR